MSDLPDYAVRTLADLQAKVAESEAQTNKLKELVNTFCTSYGVVPPYDLAQTASVAQGPKMGAPISFRPDEFYGKPLATCVREILNARKARDLGPADPREVFDALRKGGFDFEARDDETAFRAMQISISKNTAAFVRLPSGQIGLEEWYDRPRRRATPRAAAGGVTADPSGNSNPWPLPPAPLADEVLSQPGADSEETL